MNARQRTGLLLAGLGALGFSGKAIIVKLAYRHGVDPVTLIMLRMVFALPLFLAMAVWAGRGREALSRRDWAIVAALGFSGYYLSSFLDFIGLQYITAGLERLVLYLTPTLVLLMGWIFLGRRASRGQWAALGVSYLGVLVVFGREVSLEGPDVVLGTGLVLAGAVSYAAYLVCSGEVVSRLGSARLTGLASLVACVLCVAQFLAMRPVGIVSTLPAEVMWLSVLNAVACTVAPVLMVMMAVERVGSAVAAQAGMVGPVSTIVLGTLLLGEPFTAWVALGSALVLLGVWMLSRLPAAGAGAGAPPRPYDARPAEQADQADVTRREH